MADITVSIPDQHLAAIEEAFTQTFGYQPTIRTTDPETGAVTETPNPQSASDFTKERVLIYIQEVTRVFHVNRAQAAAAAAAQQVADNIKLV